MADEEQSAKKKHWNMLFRILKAAAKGTIVYSVYLISWLFLAPIAQIIPGLQQTVQTFFAVYITLMIIGELASGTIYQHFFNAAKLLFVIGYLILSLSGGAYSLTFQNVKLIVDLHFFLATATLLSILGFAKTVLEAVNYLNEKAEPKHPEHFPH
jgi:hypothetical protein